MNTQQKLQDLKEMHDKGLISTPVYEEQQKKFLAEPLRAEPTLKAPVRYPASSTSSTERSLDNPSIKLVINVGLAIVLLVGGFWLVYKLSDQQGKEALSQFASETGLGRQVIPWADRAEAAANQLVAANHQQLATSIQGITHPSGQNPILTGPAVSKLNSSIVIRLPVSWGGGLTGNNYFTTVVWEVSEDGHVSAVVLQDTAPVPVAAQNAAQLNDFFRTSVYPELLATLGGS